MRANRFERRGHIFAMLESVRRICSHPLCLDRAKYPASCSGVNAARKEVGSIGYLLSQVLLTFSDFKQIDKMLLTAGQANIKFIAPHREVNVVGVREACCWCSFARLSSAAGISNFPPIHCQTSQTKTGICRLKLSINGTAIWR